MAARPSVFDAAPTAPDSRRQSNKPPSYTSKSPSPPGFIEDQEEEEEVENVEEAKQTKRVSIASETPIIPPPPPMPRFNDELPVGFSLNTKPNTSMVNSAQEALKAEKAEKRKREEEEKRRIEDYKAKKALP